MQKIYILCYHRVNNDMDSYLRPIKVDDFEKQMQYLSRAYNPVSLESIINHIKTREPLPSKSIAVTFDDGYKDNYENAYPILKRYNIPATIFLTTNYIGTGEVPLWDQVYYILSKPENGIIQLGNMKYNLPLGKKTIHAIVGTLKYLNEKERNYIISGLADQLNIPIKYSNQNLMLSWDEIRKMSSNCITFGSHTLAHPFLNKISTDQAQDEIQLSKNIIEQQIEKPVTTFAYPSGDFGARIEKIVEKAGYSAAFSVIPGYNTPESYLYSLRRNVIGLPACINSLGASTLVFRAEMTGIMDKLRRFRHVIKMFPLSSKSDLSNFKKRH